MSRAGGEGDQFGGEAVVLLGEVEGGGEVLGHEADFEGGLSGRHDDGCCEDSSGLVIDSENGLQ